MVLFDVLQASSELRLAPITIRRRVKSGEIPYRKLGGRIFFTQEDLDHYVAVSAVPARKPDGEAGHD